MNKLNISTSRIWDNALPVKENTHRVVLSRQHFHLEKSFSGAKRYIAADTDFIVGQREDGDLRLCAPSSSKTVIPIYSLIGIVQLYEHYLYAGSRIAASSKEEKIVDGWNTFKLAPAELVLIHTPLK